MKNKNEHPESSKKSYLDTQQHTYALNSWVSHLFYGGLTETSTEFVVAGQIIENYFVNVCKQGFLKGPKITEKLVEIITHRIQNDNKVKLICDAKILKAHIKHRIFIRIKYINYISKERR